jgi:hypothetical protein
MESERLGVFEQVDHQTGALLKDKVSDILSAIEALTVTGNGSKALLSQGRSSGSRTAGRLFAAGDLINKQPTGTNEQIMQGWQKLSLKWFPFNFAAFLTVASDRVYFTQLTQYIS